MTDISDAQLLEQFVQSESETAFAMLVERYIALIHSVALRHNANSQQAQDITQAVFIILARKAGQIPRRASLPGWLYQTARLTAANWQRSESRRIRREQEACMQSTESETKPDAIWHELYPHLDSAMATLAAAERDALVLRYFQNKSMAEVGQLLGLAENTAQKRIGRALEKLRKFFTKKGMAWSASIIAGAVSANSVQAAPAGLAAMISSVAAVKGGAAGASTLTLVKGTLKFMAWAKTKTIIAVGVGLILAAGTIVTVDESLIYREPSYQGRSLSEWLADIVPDWSGQPQARQVKAAEAIRQMGTKTLPFLLNDLTTDDKLRHYRLHYLEPKTRNADQDSRQADWAFDALGSLAKPAISELNRLLEQNPGYVPGALVGIGRDALPDIFRALTNHSFFVRDNTAVSLANAIYAGKITPEEARAALPIAINNLAYTDTNSLYQNNTRWRAAGLLDALRLEPDISVPALVQGLGETDGTVAIECAQALGHFGAAGKDTIPALIKTAASTNLMLSSESTTALSLIDSNTMIRDVFDKVLGLMNDKNEAIRMQAIQALGRAGPAANAAVTALVVRTTDTNEVVRMVAAHSLGMIAQRPEESIPPLRRGLHETSRAVRAESVNALGKFGPAASAAIDDLLDAAKSDPGLKGSVQIALSHIDPKAAANLR